MSKPRLLDAFTKNSEDPITSSHSSYAEVCEWTDGNPTSEDRIGYFVSIDTSSAGNTIVKATSTSKILGITMKAPGFASDSCSYKCDESNNLLPQYIYVGTSGYIEVIDNGKCKVNGLCMPNDDGIAVPSTDNYGYLVIDRIDSTHISILVRPNTDTVYQVNKEIVNRMGDLSFSVNNQGILEVTY